MAAFNSTPQDTAPAEEGEKGLKGLTQFQELVAGLISAFCFIVIVVQVVYRSQRRQRKLRDVCKNQTLDIPGFCTPADAGGGCCQSAEAEQIVAIARASISEYREWQRVTKGFVPYTGRPVPGLVDLGAPLSPRCSRQQHPPAEDWLDFREYGRFAAHAIRSELFRLRDTSCGAALGGGQWTRCESSLTLRDTLAFLVSTMPRAHDGGEEGDPRARAMRRPAGGPELLPRTAPGFGHPQVTLRNTAKAYDGDCGAPAEVPIEEALVWLADTYERWRWSMRPGAEQTTVGEARRFVAVTHCVLQHMQSLGREQEPRGLGVTRRPRWPGGT